MSWYQTAYSWILDQRDDNPEMDRAELEKHCRQNYPFAMRRGHAYKAWLEAMRDYFGVKQKGPDLFEPESPQSADND